jgi:hypothetical protein
MINLLLIVFAAAALVIAGLALEKHSNKVRGEMIKEIEKDEPVVMEATEVPSEIQETIEAEEAPAPKPEVKQLVESQEEATAPTPAKKRRRGRPAAKKD